MTALFLALALTSQCTTCNSDYSGFSEQYLTLKRSIEIAQQGQRVGPCLPGSSCAARTGYIVPNPPAVVAAPQPAPGFTITVRPVPQPAQGWYLGKNLGFRRAR